MDKVKELMIPEAEFTKTMEEQIEPWAKSEFTEGKLESFDQTKLQYYYNVNPDEKGAVVIVHGFCEFWPKFYEIAYYFYNMGYSVFFMEQRGYGFSDRKVPEMSHVYVESYDEYVSDLKVFMDEIVVPESKTDNYVMFCHSMGGCVGTLFLEDYPKYFKTAVMSSPMHRMTFGKFSLGQASLLATVTKLLGWKNKKAPGQRDFDGINVWERSSSMSKARYDFQFNKRLETPEYQTYAGTYAWVRASLKGTKRCLRNACLVEIPVLLCEAGLDTMVDNEGHKVFVSESANTTYKLFPDSKHEIFNALDEIRDDYFEVVFSYLDEVLNADTENDSKE